MSDLWSSGTICRPSSQSRKISIGVLADSSGKKRPGTTKANDQVPIPNEERVKHVMENTIEVKNRMQGITADTIGMQTEAPAQASSPWITKGSSYRKEYAPETPLCEKQGFSIPSSSSRQNKQQGGEDVAATHSVHFFANRTSVFQSVYVRNTQKNEEGRDRVTDRVDEFAPTTAKENFFTENRCSTLKMKLWEILGNASSAKDQDPQSHSPKVDMNHTTPAENLGRMGETVAKHGQNSDTIETDSENPNHTVARPVTLSLRRKRAPTKVHLNKVKEKAPSICKHKQQEKSIFSFVEGLSGRVNNDNNSGSSWSTRKWSERQSSRTEVPKTYCPEKDNACKIQQNNNASEVAAHVEKSSSLGMIGRFHSSPECVKYQQKSDIQEKSPHQSPMAKKTDQGNVNSPNLSGNKDQQECFANTSTKNAMDPEVDFQSPTFRLNTPTPDSSPSPVPKSNEAYQGVRSPSPEDREISEGDIPSLRVFGTSKQNCYGSNVQMKSSDLQEDVQGTKTSPGKESASSQEEKNVDDGVTESSSEEENSESSEEGLPIMGGKESASAQEEKNADDGVAESSSEEENSESSKEGCEERMPFSLDADTSATPNVTLKSTKRRWNNENIIYKESSSFPPSQKGTVGSDWIHELPEQTQEDELARAVTLFAMALKGLKSKIKLAAGKKSSEVLMSVAETIRLQLENIDAHIQTDIEKLANVSKSKRRRLETKFQEQQEQLNLIHEKFKEEVNQHLQEYKETLSLLEAHQIELKGTTEKQRSSHRKLLLQVDEAIEIQLNDVQKRIMAINKLARTKMLQLKYTMSECLKDGILN